MTERSDFFESAVRYALSVLGKHEDFRPNLSLWQSWLETSFAGERRALALDVKALFERKITPGEFITRHPEYGEDSAVSK